MLYGCVHVPNFLCQAAVRPDPSLQDRPVAVTSGLPPLIRIVAFNAKARAMGLIPGMTRTQAESIDGLVLRERLAALEEEAHRALLGVAEPFSPWVEDVSDDTIVLDLSGLRNLLGPPEAIAQSIRGHARDHALYVTIGVAANVDAAIHAARATRGILILPPGAEAKTLSRCPLSVLHLDADIAAVFDRWGIRTFGQLTALPTVALSERLGQAGLQLQQMARGASPRVLVPTREALEFAESMEFEHAVSDLESLAFVFHMLLERLCERLTNYALAVSELELDLTLDRSHDEVNTDSDTVHRSIKLPVPTTDTKLLLKLLQLDLDAHPPGAPIAKLALRIEAAKPRRIQEGMFVPRGPSLDRLEVTLARLRKLVGQDRVGSPEVIEQHTILPFRMVAFRPPLKEAKATPRVPPRIALRVYRPHPPARVQSLRGAPSTVAFRGLRYRVLEVAGPWRRSGQWWLEDRWARDEWDLALSRGGTQRLFVRVYRDLIEGGWFVEGEYD